MPEDGRPPPSSLAIGRDFGEAVARNKAHLRAMFKTSGQNGRLIKEWGRDWRNMWSRN